MGTATRRKTNALAAGLDRLARAEGCSPTRSDGAVVWRMSSAHPPTPTLYSASLVFVGSGRKQAALGTETFTYDADNVLVVTSPLPMLCRTIASRKEPVLTLVVAIDVALLREVLLELEDAVPRSPQPTRTVFSTPLTPELEDAAARLVAHLGSETRARLLARSTIRELLVLILEGPHAASLRAITEGPSGRLARVLRHMNESFARHTTIGDLARMAGTSVATFHQRFKAITGSTPLQYVKTLRLTRARQLLREGGLVKAVALRVGYESESQFSREYRRLFGAPPSSTSPTSVRLRS